MPSATGSAPEPDEVAGRLRRMLDTELAVILADQPDVALAIFPNHSNVGDTAIWVGQLSVLQRLRVSVRYACDFRTYRRDELQRALPEGPILLSGGGNFGDVYPNEQGLRERILDDFPDRQIIQLPQTVWFRSEAKLDEMRRRCERAPRFVLMVRDRPSLELARTRLAVPVHLAPDMAFGLPDLRDRRDPPDTDVLWLLRRDIEAADRTARRAAAKDRPGAVRDWTRPGIELIRVMWRGYGRAQWLSWMLLRLPKALLRRREAWVQGSFATLAEIRLAIGLRLLSTGRVLVTDRLHGHVLALLMGIPHVCLDNSNGKVRNLYETWTSGHPLVRWGGSLQETHPLVNELLKRPEAQ
ncbi:MAG: polysaccharide pyruvyl transferase family protein [Acidobacteriia bacterium]|nr:polysaccharide pyruvyl transferase family protein [Terriglobia bacterium]